MHPTKLSSKRHVSKTNDSYISVVVDDDVTNNSTIGCTRQTMLYTGISFTIDFSLKGRNQVKHMKVNGVVRTSFRHKTNVMHSPPPIQKAYSISLNNHGKICLTEMLGKSFFQFVSFKLRRLKKNLEFPK